MGNHKIARNGTGFAPSVAFLLLGIMAGCSAGSAGPQGGAGPSGNAGATGDAGAVGQAGPQGATGPANTQWIRASVASPGASLVAANSVDAGTWGPFNLSGFCYQSGTNTCATFQINSSDPKAKLNDYGMNRRNANFLSDGGYLSVEYEACSSTPTTSDLEGPYDGTFAAQSSDLRTYITGSLTTGVFMAGAYPDGGSAGPACQFAGYVTTSP